VTNCRRLKVARARCDWPLDCESKRSSAFQSLPHSSTSSRPQHPASLRTPSRVDGDPPVEWPSAGLLARLSRTVVES
jgi:hypothetical protein